MFRVLEVPREGPARLSEGATLAAPPLEGTVRWVDLEDQSADELALLRERFGFHPLAIEDCSHFDQRAKLEEYGDHIFVVTHGFFEREAADVEPLELHAFLGCRYLVTVHQRKVPAIDATLARAAGDAALGRRGPDFLYYLLCDAMVDACFPILDDLAEAFEDLEENVLRRSAPEDLTRIFRLRATLRVLRRGLSPQRDVFVVLARRGDPYVSERTTVYFRDVYDHLVRIAETIDASREMLGSALEAYLTSLSNRTNDIMRRLTILSAIFLPLTFVTGFFGQNFAHLPFDAAPLMWIVIALCAALPTGMLLWFHRHGWL